MYKVLFVCRHNAGRSVIAESLAQHYLPNNRFSIASGGVEPSGNINPLVKSYLEDNQLPILTITLTRGMSALPSSPISW